MMRKQKVCFIVNPIAGKVKKKQLPSRIAEFLDAKKYDYEIAYTEYPGHARVLAQEAVKKHFDIVVAAGGDGSINEIGTC
jgi:Sphingosine kinase and enzymes related to eukaryotic diacylglycerol kinase